MGIMVDAYQIIKTNVKNNYKKVKKLHSNNKFTEEEESNNKTEYLRQ